MAKKSSGATEVHGFISVDKNVVSRRKPKSKDDPSASKLKKKEDTKDGETNKASKETLTTSTRKSKTVAVSNDAKIKIQRKTVDPPKKETASKKNLSESSIVKRSTVITKGNASDTRLVEKLSSKDRTKLVSREQKPVGAKDSPRSVASKVESRKTLSNVEVGQKRKPTVETVSKSQVSEGSQRKNDSKSKSVINPKGIDVGKARSSVKTVVSKSDHNSERTKKSSQKESLKSDQVKGSHSGIIFEKHESSRSRLNLVTKSSEPGSQQITLDRNYKDVVYFEVDVSDTTKSKKDKERDNKKEEEPELLRRQGTFVKEDEESRGEEAAGDLPAQEEPQPDEQEYEYEDDFEDYESDFEEYISESGVSSEGESSHGSMESCHEDKGHVRPEADQRHQKRREGNKKVVEEEKKLDSGNYDLTSRVVLPESVRRRQLDEIKEAISRENTIYMDSDQGIINIQEEIVNDDFGLDMLDFDKARRKESLSQMEVVEKDVGVKERERRRCSLVMEMVSLCEDHLSLFTMRPIPYEVFMGFYRNNNITQKGVQTAVEYTEDEAQTVDTSCTNKWTQHPPACHRLTGSSTDLAVYLQDKKGFGTDELPSSKNKWMSFYGHDLINFVTSAGQVVLTLLEEEDRYNSEGQRSGLEESFEHDFSSGHIPLTTDNIDFLKDRTISQLLFSPHNPNVFLTCHKSVEDVEKLKTFAEQYYGRSVLCWWDLSTPQEPQTFMVASCQISTVCFDQIHPHIVFAGLTDGSVCLWDLHEKTLHHEETTAGSMKHLLRTPTYCTPCIEVVSCACVVGMKSFGYPDQDQALVSHLTPTQLVSLDCEGLVMVWVVMHTDYRSRRQQTLAQHQLHTGLAFWGSVKLVQTSSFPPHHYLPFKEPSWSVSYTCMAAAPQAARSVLIGTNMGSVILCPLSGLKAQVPLYHVDNIPTQSVTITCIESCPYDYPIFLVGCNNGTVRLHGINRTTPYKVFVIDFEIVGVPITKISWSNFGPGFFFIQTENLWLHIWNICKSDQMPLLSISMGKINSSAMDLATADMKYPYLGLVVDNSRLEIHKIKEHFIPKGFVVSSEDFELFSLYIERLM